MGEVSESLIGFYTRTRIKSIAEPLVLRYLEGHSGENTGEETNDVENMD
jgi:hypothetical protein